ncbi:MAG: hypothetical protein KJ072_04445 [Verrucomicrobia bacterium]|nr:hypothetical protein [Verrucomicrobiota bacterium]
MPVLDAIIFGLLIVGFLLGLQLWGWFFFRACGFGEDKTIRQRIGQFLKRLTARVERPLKEDGE